MRKKSIYLENELVQELRKKIAHGYSGDIIDGFFFFLNKNIEILKRENVIFENVQQIRELKNGVLEHGDFTRDIIKNAIMREPYQGKRKLIKALIIATFGEDWVPVYNKYFTKDGDQLESVIEEVSSYGQEKVTLSKNQKFVLLYDFYDSFSRLVLFNKTMRITLDSEIIESFRFQLSKIIPNFFSYSLDAIRSEIDRVISNRFFIITMDDGSYFSHFDYNFNITRTAYSINNSRNGPYFRVPRDDDRDIISQGQNCYEKYIRSGNQKPIVLCDDGVGTGKSLEKILNIFNQLKLDIAKIVVLLNPNQIFSISNNDIETIIKIEEPFAWLSERDLFWGLPRSGVTCSIADENSSIITGVPYTIDDEMIKNRIADFGDLTSKFRMLCLKFNIEFWSFIETVVGEKIYFRDVQRLRGFGETMGVSDVRMVDYLHLINKKGYRLC